METERITNLIEFENSICGLIKHMEITKQYVLKQQSENEEYLKRSNLSFQNVIMAIDNVISVLHDEL
jgi:hypothetical protein